MFNMDGDTLTSVCTRFRPLIDAVIEEKWDFFEWSVCNRAVSLTLVRDFVEINTISEK